MYSRIFFVGPFPPPVHGASVVTVRAWKLLEATGRKLIRCNVAPNPGAFSGISRLLRYLQSYVTVALALPNSAVYISLSGGRGLFFDYILTRLASLRKFDLIFHHHSFAYIHKRNVWMSRICAAAAGSCTHVFLSDYMSERFLELYRTHSNTLPISNLAFFDMSQLPAASADGPIQCLGYLSNISLEKGIDRFLDAIELLRKKGSALRAKIAGPFSDRATEQYVMTRIKELGSIEYVGAVYGKSKEEFFESIDYFVFPSRYENEAQPMVVFEAKLFGLPVAVTNRGTLRDMVSESDVLLDEDGANYSILVDHILQLENSPELYKRAKYAAVERRQKLISDSHDNLVSFIDLF